MAKLFDIEKNRIVPNADVLAIPAIKKIWVRDKTEEKETALKELSYIVFLCDFHSPYRDIREFEKESLIIKDVFKSKWTPDNLVKEAVETYKKLQETPSMRLLNTARSTLDKLSGYFEQIDFSEMDVLGKPVYSAIDLTRNLKEVGNIVKSLVNLERQVRLELEEHSVRGGSEIMLLEDPDEDDEIDNTFETN